MLLELIAEQRERLQHGTVCVVRDAVSAVAPAVAQREHAVGHGEAVPADEKRGAVELVEGSEEVREQLRPDRRVVQSLHPRALHAFSPARSTHGISESSEALIGKSSASWGGLSKCAAVSAGAQKRPRH